MLTWVRLACRARLGSFLLEVPLTLGDSYYMIKNNLAQWKDRSHSSITDEELEALSDAEYQSYLAWRVQVNLDFMVAEGYVTEFIENGTKIYRLKSEAELQAEVDNL